MRLPSAEQAIVSPAKIRDYLLSSEHPVGRLKAAFFGALGYTRRDWQRLQQDFLTMAGSTEAILGQQSGYGQKYEVHGRIQGPSGRRAAVVTIWIIRTGERAPRFVTAFPGETR